MIFAVELWATIAYRNDEHKLIKLGWTDANFWDTVFDSTENKEPTVEKDGKTKGNSFFSDIFDEASNT